jgi:enamine deaminase RidA (YjgF/YER057c/UK114 family)
MRLTTYPWLGRDFVRLWGQGAVGRDAPAATRDLLARFAEALAAHGLTLDSAVKTRLFAHDRASRDAGSLARREVFSGRARCASSGLIAPAVLDADAAVALEVIVLRPGQTDAEKQLVEYEPQRTPLRYLTYDGLLFTSGETQPGATLAEQVAATLAIHAESLAMSGVSWENAVLISCFLREDQTLAALRESLHAAAPVAGVPLECEFVAGFAGEGRLVEVEVTATLG